MPNSSREAFIKDVSTTIDALRDASIGLSRYLTGNERKLDESQQSNLKASVAGLTIQLSVLSVVLCANDWDSASNAELLNNAKTSVARTKKFLDAADVKE